MKKFIAILALVMSVMLMLTGCVATTTIKEEDIDRPTAQATCGETVLTETPEEEEPEESVISEDGSVGEPLDNNIYNAVAAGSSITLTGKHSSGIQSVCYRINSGDPVVVKAASADVPVTSDLDKLEFYVINGKGIASHWVTYFFSVE